MLTILAVLDLDAFWQGCYFGALIAFLSMWIIHTIHR